MADKAVEKDEKVEPQKGDAVETLTEDSLLKSIQDLEAKTEKPKAEPETKVETAKLEKSAKETVEANASEDLKKALDVSETLKEFADLIGTHVDDSLTALQKSVAAGAERDLGIARVLKSLTDQVGALATKIEAYGQEPTSPAKAREVKARAEEVLEKSGGSTEKSGDEKPDFATARKNILVGFEELCKSASNPSEQSEYTTALIKFETTGQISEGHFAATQRAWKKLNS